MIPADLNTVDNIQAGTMSKEMLVGKYQDVFAV